MVIAPQPTGLACVYLQTQNETYAIGDYEIQTRVPVCIYPVLLQQNSTY